MMAVATTALADFVFGGIEQDDPQLLETERASCAGIRHRHALQPADPRPHQPVRITVQVGPELAVDRLTAYVTCDGTRPAGSQGVAVQGNAVQLLPCGVRWEPLVWDYVRLWEGELPGQPAGTLVQYCIEGWRSFEPPCSVWSTEQNLDRTVREQTLYGYHVDELTIPEWARAAVVYHVFVDRFSGVQNRWLAAEELEHFAGGTLRGVIDRLGYIAELGCNVLWLSPVFVTESYHGYDTTDYRHVDPRFGSDADLIELFAQAHAHGLRVLLDFVANHTSVAFAPFVAARNDPASEYRNWFHFHEGSRHGYRCFFDVASMPQLETDVPAVRDFLCETAQHWLMAGADGFRLDYAAGPSPLFWSAFRAACRAVRPDCWLIGEVTRAGDALQVYQGRLDGCLEFAFCRAVRLLCALPAPGLSLSQFANQIQANRAALGEDFVQPAFIDNHDMNRFLWAAGNDLRRLRLALALLFGLGGPPCLYYGTEVGLGQPRAKGPWREEARHPMLWGEAQDAMLLAYTRWLTKLRRSHPALQEGAMATLYLDDTRGLWLVERSLATDRIWLAVNLSAEIQTLELPAGEGVDWEGTPVAGTVALAPVSATWYRMTPRVAAQAPSG
jgi:glycosidase